MSEYNIQMNKYNALNAGYDQLYPQPMKHANTHAKDGSDPITPADIGAYTKGETDTLLAKKMVSELGQAGANLLEWANAQAVGGCFYINPTVTTADVPIVTWYAGILEINGGGRRMIISTSGGGSPITYVNVTSAGVWQGWERLATATDLDTKVSKSGDTMTGTLVISNGEASASLANDSAEFKQALSKGGKYTEMVFTDPTTNSNVNLLQIAKWDGSRRSLFNILHAGNAQSLGFSKIATGSYIGTGTSDPLGGTQQNSLTFDFEPKMLAVVADGSNMFFPGFLIVRGQTYSDGIGSFSGGSVGFALHITWSGNTVSWWSGNRIDIGTKYPQMNVENTTYRYVALG